MEGPIGSLRDPKVALQNICDVVNALKDTEHGRELPLLIERWQKASSLKEMLSGDGPLWHEVSIAWMPGFEVKDVGKSASFDTDILISKNPRPQTPREAAVRLFALLVLNPLCEKLGGPCSRCGQYYIKKRASQKVYCSARCGNAATAAKRMSMKWTDHHQKKLQRAQQAVREWQQIKSAEPWKEWIERRYPEISRKFLTRAVNNEELSRTAAGDESIGILTCRILKLLSDQLLRFKPQAEV